MCGKFIFEKRKMVKAIDHFLIHGLGLGLACNGGSCVGSSLEIGITGTCKSIWKM